MTSRQREALIQRVVALAGEMSPETRSNLRSLLPPVVRESREVDGDICAEDWADAA